MNYTRYLVDDLQAPRQGVVRQRSLGVGAHRLQGDGPGRRPLRRHDGGHDRLPAGAGVHADDGDVGHLTDRSLWTLRMASANKGAMESCCTFSERLDSGMGIVSEKTSFSISDLAIRSIAEPENTEYVTAG